MDVIKAIVNEGYSLVNFTADKKPCGKDGNPMKGWNIKTFGELKAEHNYKCPRWGIKLGLHPENQRRVLCFDFDVYGSTHPDTACPIAESELANYTTDCGDEFADGLFCGSTVGNAGLLVDYTDNEIFCKFIDKLNSFKNEKGNTLGTSHLFLKEDKKFLTSEIEFFWGDRQVIIIPPSATVSKVTNTVVQARKFKNENWILKLEENSHESDCRARWMYDHIKTLIEKLQSERAKTPSSQQVLSVDGKDDKWLDLLMNYIGNPKNDSGIGHKIERRYFICICGALKSNGYDPQVWRDWVALDRNHGDGMRTWDSLNSDRKTPIEVFKKIAKIINPDGFLLWKENWKLFLPYETLMKGENNIAKFLVTHLSPYLRCYIKIWWLYDERTCLWTRTDAPTSFIITTLQELIDDAVTPLVALNATEQDENKKKEMQKKITNYNDYRRLCCKSSIYNSLQQFLKSDLACDKEWCERFDNIPYQIPYKNGLWCLRTSTFREGILPSDYLTHTLPFNYEPAVEADKAWLREQLKKICNNNETHLNRFLSEFGMWLCGDPSLIQELYVFKGEKAGNGKSSLLDALTEIIPNLCKKLDSNVFEKSAKSTLHKTTATLLGVRIAWVNEVDASAVQDEGTLKTWTDGNTATYNALYGVNMSLKITYKVVIVGNNAIKVKGDNGIMRRMIVNQFDSEFSTEVTEDDPVNCIFKATDFKKVLIEKKHTLLALLYDYSKLFCKEKKLEPMPKEWITEKEQLRETLAKFDTFVDKNYEWADEHPEWEVWSDEIEDLAKLQKLKFECIKTEFKRMKLWNKPIVYDSQARCTKNGIKMKGKFINVRLREDGEEKLEPPAYPQ